MVLYLRHSVVYMSNMFEDKISLSCCIAVMFEPFCIIGKISLSCCIRSSFFSKKRTEGNSKNEDTSKIESIENPHCSIEAINE